MTSEWRKNRTWFGGWIWWSWWWVGLAVLIYGVAQTQNLAAASAQEVRSGYSLAAVGHLAMAGSLVFLVFLVRRISGPLHPEALMPGRGGRVDQAGRPVPQRFCTQCGARMSPTDMYCGGCGTPQTP